MYSQKNPGKVGRLPLLFSLQLLCLMASAQVRYSGSTVDLLISGTSTLHDWTMKSVKAECTAVFNFNAGGQISGLSSLIFSTPVNALKSEHTAMDNNAYKALKTDEDPVISYTLTSVTLTPGAGGASTVTCNGKLTIAGATREAQVIAVCKPGAGNTMTITGSEKISMKDFNIDPPTFMLGTIKTGNDIVLSFNLILKRA
ncbi:MAG TPA: YceI family protein [Puia sp.]|nr:YceI family protein [Puia sp.]